MIRLYANILQDIVLMSIIGLMFIFKAGLEVLYHFDCRLRFLYLILVAFLQAYIHIVISALFLSAVEEHHHMRKLILKKFNV
jgi:F0F1-type ATP synthase membrane subunit a